MKVNLHITEKCNYHCKYCFAKFGKHEDLDILQWKYIIDNLKSSKLVDKINFAGEELIFYQDFPTLVKYTHKHGLSLSLISNGSIIQSLSPDIINEFDMIGISVDSFDKKTLFKLEEYQRNNNYFLSKEKLIKINEWIKSINPNIKIKINTVVNKYNKNEIITDINKIIKIDRWKLLRIQPFISNKFTNKNLLITADEYKLFCNNNNNKYSDFILENSMVNTYIIIDNKGNLLDNTNNQYHIVGNLLQENFIDLYKKYNNSILHI